MKRVVRWTFWHDEEYPEYDTDPISQEEYQDYSNAVVRELKEKGYGISGFAHQGQQFCTPVFDDGKRYNESYRVWGQCMADALGIKGEYVYAQWAWCAPEEGNLPKAGDWQETEESLTAQAERWKAYTDQQIKELKAKTKSMTGEYSR